MNSPLVSCAALVMSIMSKCAVWRAPGPAPGADCFQSDIPRQFRNAWMRGNGLLFVLFMSSALTSAGQGKVAIEGPMFSTNFGADRMVRIYLPPSYKREDSRRFPVLYIHDGQNAFTTVGANVAFGWG